MRSALASELALAGGAGSAHVLDLSAARVLFSSRARVPRIPASLQKLYTTTSALLLLGADTRFQTVVLGRGRLEAHGVWRGDLLLEVRGDPRPARGVESLAGQLTAAGIRRVSGHVRAARSGLAAARSLVRTLRRHGVGARVGRWAAAPPDADELARTRSPSLGRLVTTTNRRSDNSLAETLLDGLGAEFGAARSTAAGAAVVERQLRRLGVQTRVADGSGLSRANRTSAGAVVRLLEEMSDGPEAAEFERSLPAPGRNGTLRRRMRGTAAQGRCRAKTGTLSDVSNLAGYCRARNGHRLAFAFLLNGVIPFHAEHHLDRMAVALARYRSSSSRRSSSPRTSTPSRSAFSSLAPAASPASR